MKLDTFIPATEHAGSGTNPQMGFFQPFTAFSMTLSISVLILGKNFDIQWQTLFFSAKGQVSMRFHLIQQMGGFRVGQHSILMGLPRKPNGTTSSAKKRLSFWLIQAIAEPNAGEMSPFRYCIAANDSTTSSLGIGSFSKAFFKMILSQAVDQGMISSQKTAFSGVGRENEMSKDFGLKVKYKLEGY
jgi:hypothetical protein